ncbi:MULTISPECIES: HpcH/HpaI aldolase family protein [unclassified Pseudonocardia]|uniref:HpcH/HpaI aldolase family protein n=1 Tax=unclassified Pseudonocardia TaxID=2619320 RepID=UPI001CF62478|nr:aldolase/citrate lyase family protein [Pseudonocardia sp. ICBG162]
MTGTGPVSPRAVLRPGARALGTWLKLAAPEPVEIVAGAGFDFVVVDLEHAPIGIETAAWLLSSARAHGLVPFVRIPDHRPSTVQLMLDAGACGLFVPRVDSLAQAEAVARAFSFPPEGTRGSGGTSRAGHWGRRPTPDYLGFGRDEAMLIVQLEAESGIADAERIAALPAVAGLFVGAADLALSTGSTPSSDDVLAHIGTARAAAHGAGKVFGLAYGAAPAAIRTAFDHGTDFVVGGNDASLLASAAADLVAGVRETA